LQADKCQRFFLDSNNNQIKYDTGSEVLDLTSLDITVEKLEFVVSGDSPGDDIQPFVTIYIEAHTGDSPKLKVQTSVSQRNMDYY